MKTRSLFPFALAALLIQFPTSILAEDKIVRSFTSPPKNSRLEACAAAKKDAQSWAEDEARRPLASALVIGRQWVAEIDGYSDCDCEKSKTVAGEEWKYSVDAKLKARR